MFQSIELLSKIKAVGVSLFLEESKTLIVSDLHIGYEQSLRDAGTFLIKEQSIYTKNTLKNLINETNAKTIILNGDVKHEFGSVNLQEATDLPKILDELKSLVNVKVILGNHDKLTQKIIDKKSIKDYKYLIIDDCLITHGDSKFEDLKVKESFSNIIIGHEHPALDINDNIRNERVKCFLMKQDTLLGGNKVNIIIMPSFNNLVEGSAVIGGRPLGSFLLDYSGFSAFAVFNDRILAFGKLEDLQRLMNSN